MKRLSFASIALLFIAFAIYSSTGIFSKLASMQDFLSMNYCFFLAIVILMLAIYAVLWQMILKSISLTQAYLFKSSAMIFGLLYAHYLFNEHISLQNIVGASIIFVGVTINSFSQTT